MKFCFVIIQNVSKRPICLLQMIAIKGKNENESQNKTRLLSEFRSRCNLLKITNDATDHACTIEKLTSVAHQVTLSISLYHLTLNEFLTRNSVGKPVQQLDQPIENTKKPGWLIIDVPSVAKVFRRCKELHFFFL